MWGELEQLNTSTQEQLRTILNEEQMQEYLQMREEGKEQMRERFQQRMQQRRGSGVGMEQ